MLQGTELTPGASVEPVGSVGVNQEVSRSAKPSNPHQIPHVQRSSEQSPVEWLSPDGFNPYSGKGRGSRHERLSGKLSNASSALQLLGSGECQYRYGARLDPASLGILAVLE